LLNKFRHEPKAPGNTTKNGAPIVSNTSKDGLTKAHTFSKKQPFKVVDIPLMRVDPNRIDL
ncbi:hypothetical protein Tco_0674351, partial [Tanacetum coccineum]